MTEQEWLACQNPQQMLDWIATGHVVATDRQLRLFACACCRQIWHLLTDQRSRNAVEVVELIVDGLAYMEELLAATYPASAAVVSAATTAGTPMASVAAWNVLSASAWRTAVDASAKARIAIAKGTAWSVQSDLLRDIVGNPFHPTSVVAREWITPTVLMLARAAYEERQDNGTLEPERLLVLADALEEAGCEGELLAHLRSPGPHVRGCWAVDLILGKR